MITKKIKEIGLKLSIYIVKYVKTLNEGDIISIEIELMKNNYLETKRMGLPETVDWMKRAEKYCNDNNGERLLELIFEIWNNGKNNELG